MTEDTKYPKLAIGLGALIWGAAVAVGNTHNLLNDLPLDHELDVLTAEDESTFPPLRDALDDIYVVENMSASSTLVPWAVEGK